MSDSDPINMQWRQAQSETPREVIAEGKVKRKEPFHIDPVVVPTLVPNVYRRRSPMRDEIDGDDFEGQVRRRRTTSDEAVVYVKLPKRHPSRWDHDEDFEGSVSRVRMLTDEAAPVYVLPLRNPSRLVDEDYDDGHVRRTRIASDAAADFRWLPELAKPRRPHFDDRHDDETDEGIISRSRHVSDEEPPIYSLPKRIVARDWSEELWPDPSIEGRSLRRGFGNPEVLPLLRLVPRHISRPSLDDDFPDFMLETGIDYSRRPPWPPVLPPVGEPLRFYLSGAAADDDNQPDVDLSLGNYRSEVEASRVGWLLRNTIAGLQVVAASRANGVGGVGSIFADGSIGVRYSAPDGSPGPLAIPANLVDPVTVVDGTDPAKWVRVQRVSGGNLLGIAQIEFVDQFNNVFAQADATNAMTIAGGSRYRAVFLRAEEAITGLVFYVGTLGTAVSGGLTAVLPASGFGTITGPDYCFESWPHKGWIRIETSGGVLKEIVYYLIRSHNEINVLPSGRARLGTSATAGATTDILYPVPGVRIGWELASPALAGPVQTIANESTAPTGVTWSTGRTAATGVVVGALATQHQGALWIHRETPSIAWGSAEMQTLIMCQCVDKQGQTLIETLAGLYRQAFDALEQYELHHGIGSPPVLDLTPEATSASLPFVYGVPLTFGVDHYFVLNRRNKYDLVSQLTEATRVRVGVFGTELDPPPSAPAEITWSASAGGTFRAIALYFYQQDGDLAADKFAVYVRYDGSAPDPSIDTPTLVDVVQTGGATSLDWTSPAQVAGTVGKLLVRMHRSSDGVESENTAILTATAEETGPSSGSVRMYWRRRAEDL